MNEQSTRDGINIENHLTSNQTQTISISFDDVRQQIESMPGLSETDTGEVIDKINSIEKIMTAHESRKTKWQKVSPILKWMADKSVDVGIALLPLIFKIGG